MNNLPDKVLPVEFAGLGIGGVIDVRIMDVPVICLDGLELLGVHIEQAAHRDHGMKVFVVE